MIETAELKQRIIYNLNPKKTTDFIQSLTANPDLYGPVWISSALIFMSIFCSSASFVLSRIFFDADRKSYEYNYAMLGFIFSTVYSFLFFFPFIATIWLKFLAIETTLVKVGTADQNVAIYGYSYTVFVLATLVVWYPLDWLRTSALAVCGVFTAGRLALIYHA